jgi:chaperonin GroES
VTFRPLQDRVLVRRIEEEEKTEGGIIIPDAAKEKPMEGEVLAAGPGTRGDDGRLHPLDVKVGDRVLFGKRSGTEIEIDGEDLVVMKESDIMGAVVAYGPVASGSGSPPVNLPVSPRGQLKTEAPEEERVPGGDDWEMMIEQLDKAIAYEQRAMNQLRERAFRRIL